MQLRWSVEAASDLERITNYLFEETPQHAPELVRAIYKACPSPKLDRPDGLGDVEELAASSAHRPSRHGGALAAGAFSPALGRSVQ